MSKLKTKKTKDKRTSFKDKNIFNSDELQCLKMG